MDNFIVSARKYRPQTFDTVVGQPTITSTLKNAIRNGQLAQAFLFCGPRGVGKTTCARILAKTINCEHLSPNMEACDQCPSCTSFNENASFNIYELDGASNNSVEDIRTLVDQVRIPPQMGKYKVYIIDEVHMLSASAFNAFLKTLEEPPAYAKFILATTEKHKILPTILSRCQIFDFRRITVDDIASHLQFVASSEGVDAGEDALHVIAQKADGAMRDALSVFDQLVSFAGKKLTYNIVLENLNVLDYEYFFRITGEILSGNIPATLLTIHEIIEKGFDGQHFLLGFGEHLRNLLVCKDPATVRLLETSPGIRERYLEQANQCETSFLLRALDLHGKCDLNYKISNNKRLHIELALVQMCHTEPTAALPSSSPPAAPPEKKTPVSTVRTEPPAPPPAKPAATVRMKDVEGSIQTVLSIRKVPAPAEVTPGGEAGQDENRDLAEPYTADQVLNLWDQFAEKIKGESQLLYSTLRNNRPDFSEAPVIKLNLDSKLMGDELNLRKTELLEFIRSGVRNYTITLELLIDEKTRDKKPYTDREKFETMAEKNPALRNLREQMDLEIGY